MRKRFQYTINYAGLTYDQEKAAAAPENAKEYFRKLTRTNPSAERLQSKAKKLLAKVRHVTDFWRCGDEGKEYCDVLIRELVDYVNRFNFYRFKNNLPDYMPYWAFELFSRFNNVIDWADRGGLCQKDFAYQVAVLYFHLSDEKEHGNGIYLCMVIV